MVVNVIAFKGAEKNFIVRTNNPLKLDLTSEETVTILDDSTKAWIDVVPANILYISSGDEEELSARMDEIRENAKKRPGDRPPKKAKGKPSKISIS